MAITITPVEKDNTKQNVKGKDEWWIHVDENYAGSIFQARDNKSICVSPNGAYGANSGLHSWWGVISSLSDAKKFVRKNFPHYALVENQAHLNSTFHLESLKAKTREDPDLIAQSFPVEFD